MDAREYKNTNSNDFRKAKIAECYREYQVELMRSDAMDFDDMIFNTVKLLRENDDVLELYQHQFKYVIVDEYQDISRQRFDLTTALSEVCDGKIINCSRHIHSVKHNVPKSLKLFAEQIVKSISENDDFPKNYVIDIAEFEKECDRFIDIVELNPFSTSQCYVNNSVFLQADNKIIDTYRVLRFGYEYCLDYLDNPEKYVIERLTQENYEYSSDSQYCFVQVKD